MKSIIENINKAFENRVRLGVMSALIVNDFLDFNTLKEILGVTDGNLASHLKALEKNGYVTFRKEFLGRKPNTKYAVTDSGREAFRLHIQAIEKLIK